MDITLVTSTYNDDVHGTDNDKRTGCGISLFKPENITRFRRGDVMTDLKEITCEKCKAALAKKIIKSDKKEMSRIIKEEKLRAKKGIEDEGIVPLGNTTARITGQPRAASEPVRQPVQTPPPVQPAYNQPAYSQPAYNQPAYNQPVMNAPEPETVPQPAILPKNITGTNVPIDSSLAQFAINVPKEEDPVQEDDFLAQFAIQKPEEEEETVGTVENTVPQNDFLAQFAIPSPAVQQPAEVYAPDSAVPENSGMDDITFNEPAPDVDVVEQQYGESRYQNDDSIIDIEENEVSAVEPDHNLGTEDNDAEVDLTSVSEWNIVANQIFGFEGAEELNPDSDAEMEGIPAPIQQTAPVIEDIPAPVQQTAPVIEDIPAPVQQTAPVIEDIPAPVQQTAPVIEDIPAPVQQTAPVIDDIAAAAAAAAASFNRFTAPVQPVGVPVYPTKQTAPVIEDIPAPVQQTAPVIEDIPAPVQQTAPVIEDIPAPAPVPTPAPVPAQNDNERGMNMHIYSSGDITTAPAPQQTAPVQPAPSVQPTAPVQPAPAVQKPAAVQPQIVNVPQFTGMDANGQPVYTYIQMQMTGYDASGKPILAPLPGQPAPQQMPQTAAPQTAAPQTPTAASTGYTVPTANISKIAVNQHTKPTSRAFVQAIANSKGYANKNLIETQGMQVNAPMLTSIEDVLSQIDTGSAARAQSGQPAAAPKKAAPVYNEYKANAQPASRMPASARPAPQQRHVEDDYRFMTKAEIKAKKKQDKIDAKFRKDMGKRGL